MKASKLLRIFKADLEKSGLAKSSIRELVAKSKIALYKTGGRISELERVYNKRMRWFEKYEPNIDVDITLHASTLKMMGMKKENLPKIPEDAPKQYVNGLMTYFAYCFSKEIEPVNVLSAEYFLGRHRETPNTHDKYLYILKWWAKSQDGISFDHIDRLQAKPKKEMNYIKPSEIEKAKIYILQTNWHRKAKLAFLVFLDGVSVKLASDSRPVQAIKQKNVSEDTKEYYRDNVRKKGDPSYLKGRIEPRKVMITKSVFMRKFKELVDELGLVEVWPRDFTRSIIFHKIEEGGDT